MLDFKNSEVASKYECTESQDRIVTKLGIYSGLLSDITPAMAEAFVIGGSNLVIRKETGSES